MIIVLTDLFIIFSMNRASKYLALIAVSFILFSCQLPPKDVKIDKGFSYSFPSSGGTETVQSINDCLDFGNGFSEAGRIRVKRLETSLIQYVKYYYSYGWVEVYELTNEAASNRCLYDIKVLPNDTGKDREMTIRVANVIHFSDYADITIFQAGK